MMGVLQGTIIGPLLFMQCISNLIIYYANDTVFLCCMENLPAVTNTIELNNQMVV